MVNGIIYYGAPITGSQTVSEALRIRNINLLKSSVRSIEPSGVRYIVSPSYDIYVENLHIAMESAETGQPLPVSTTNRYIRSSNKTNLEGFSKTHVIWNYEGIQPAMDQTAMDAMKARFDPSEISVHGKPCFVAELTIPQLVALKASSVNTTTPTVSGAINVASAYAQIKLQRIARSFLLAHQYPLSSDGADTRAEMKKLFNIVAWNATHKITANFGGPSSMTEEKDVYGLDKPSADKDKACYVLHMNGIQSKTTYRPYYHSSASLPNNDGLIFPYVSELSKEDDGTVPEVIERYFFHALDNDAQGCALVFESIKSGWGNIKRTSQGHILAHLYSGIKLAIDTGAEIKILFGTEYSGFSLHGKGFGIVFNGSLIEPVPYGELQPHFDDTFPGHGALVKILDLLNMTPEEKATAKATPPTTIHVLRALILRHGYNVNNEQAIKAAAVHLKFVAQPYLAMNSFNITKILDAMSQPASQDHQYPMNPLYILSPNRDHRLLSAFGDHGFTFRIPSGRAIDLDSTEFSYKEKSGKAKGAIHIVTKMHYQIVPIGKALTDFDVTRTMKNVFSPVGTPLSRKASSKSVFRELTGNSATEVLGALRRAVGVTIVQGGAGGSNKRGNSGDLNADNKRAKLDAAMDDI